ncbi:MAG TPA: hypothetical protein DCS75_08560 [Gemmatimonadetes bacterium]|nr:hypothetical protein [Gemmatimonadota bacterium]HBV06083.1 hypothetical protein [Gemmatimonadota bacterium]
MPESRFIGADRLKLLVAYLAVAFVIMLAIGAFLDRSGLRSGLILSWLLLLPVGAWHVLKRPLQ